jgi:hypothetical protein
LNDDLRKISEGLIEKYFGDSEYFDKTVLFYSNFFPDVDQLQDFLEKVFSYRKRNDANVPRLMINRIERFSNILEDILDKTEVKIFFLITAVESLYGLSENKLDSKRKILSDFFVNYTEDNDQRRLLNGIKYSIGDPKYTYIDDGQMALSDIADLLTELRNKMAHEGTYGYFSFPSDGDCPLLNVLNVYVGSEFDKAREKLKRLKKRKGVTADLDRYKRRAVYQRGYEISITYGELRKIMIRGMIN